MNVVREAKVAGCRQANNAAIGPLPLNRHPKPEATGLEKNERSVRLVMDRLSAGDNIH